MDQGQRTEQFATSCKPCVFAQWEDGVQLDNGCDLQRLEKYRAMNKVRSHEDGYFIVDTVCNTCRGEAWLKQVPIHTNAIAQVEREVAIDVACIILSIDDGIETIAQLLPQRLQGCVNQKQVQPAQIIVVVKNQHINSRMIYDILDEKCKDIPHKLVKILEDTCDIGRCIDLGVQHVTSRYYLTSYLQHSIPINTLKILNHLINVELQPISLVTPVTEYSGMIVQTLLHKTYGGNRLMPLYEKITEAAQLQNLSNIVITWEDLWNYHE